MPIALGLAVVVVIAVVAYFIREGASDPPPSQEISIAVLPFKNESADSTNRYFVNGMMESILNHLQKIEDLRVISRTSVEKYRQARMSAPEIARELGVDYIVEGSGQKLDKQILLSVQLIAASEDRRLWSQQYQREFADVFSLQSEVSQNIASRIEVMVSPAVKARMEAIPTENLEAYDQYLKGLDFIRQQTETGLDSGLVYFGKAIELDPEFAHPYAFTAVCYYYLDLFRTEKLHQKDLERFSDKALLLDPELPEGLISRGLYYMHTQRYQEAIEYFERVLEINPNSVWTHNYLSEIYNIYLPDSEKYLVHALSVLQLDMTGTNKSERSNTHLIISNAFAQSGMMDKAKEHIRRSLEYDPENVFSQYLNIYIDLAIDLDLDRARQRMEGVYSSDTTRLDVLNELASLCYKQKDYPASYEYYGRFVRRKEALGFTIFPEQDIEIAYVMRKMGQAERAEEFRDSYEAWLNSNEGVYVPFLESLLHLYDGETDQALDDLDTFVQNGEYMYWFVLMLDGDPLFEGLANNRRYVRIMQTMAENFNQLREDRIRRLNELNLLD